MSGVAKELRVGVSDIVVVSMLLREPLPHLPPSQPLQACFACPLAKHGRPRFSVVLVGQPASLSGALPKQLGHSSHAMRLPLLRLCRSPACGDPG